MVSMTSRHRVTIALNHEEPDLVPLDFSTGGNSSPVPEFYHELLDYWGLAAEVRPLPHMLRLAVVDERVLQSLEIDTRPVGMRPATRGRRLCDEPGCFYDDWGVKWRVVQAGCAAYNELAESPLADAGLADLDHYPWWPDPLDADRYAGVREEARRLYHTTEYALVGTPGFNGVWERAWFLCGFARMLEGLLLEPQFVHAVLRRVTDLCKAALSRYLDLVGPTIQVIKMGDDLGAQDGPLMAPALYRRVIKPYHKELFDLIKQRCAARVFLHSCGSVYRLLPDLVDAGVEILNPVQVSARDMDTARLKAEFGDRLSFMGAVDTQHVLPFGTPDEVRSEVERRIADLGPGGGYILAPVHNVQADVPPENLVAMYHHARVAGKYPLRRSTSSPAAGQ
jgi:uroporphyrinogen decarboxylase